jgi:predicted ester cyclase
MTTAAPPASASNTELIRWAFDQLNTRSTANLRQFWDAETHERFPNEVAIGRDAIVDYFDTVFRAMPDFHIEVIASAAEADDVFVQWKLTGTHTGGPFSGIEATGKPVAMDGIDHFVIRDGRVISNFVVFDQMQFARAVGLLPPDGTAADRALKGAFNLKTKALERVRTPRR